MARDSQGSSNHLKVVGEAYGKRKDLIYEYDALRAITIHPAEHIGIADRVGSLEEGKDADIVIFDNQINVINTISEGHVIYSKQD